MTAANSATPAATIAILAGGQSRRMGTDKALLPVKGQPLIERVAARCQTLDLPLIVIANQVERFAGLGLPVYPDVIPGKGSMGGIYTALVHSETPHTLCVACDMPFVSPALMARLIELAPGYDVVIPEIDGRMQALHAVYGQGCRQTFYEHIQTDRLKIIGAFDGLAVHVPDAAELRALDPDGRAFLNINTPDDLLRVRQWLEQDSTSS
ncbi:MAG: molybdenum cofactor guanylyltransferase [Phototrophicaceae bacterium]